MKKDTAAPHSSEAKDKVPTSPFRAKPPPPLVLTSDVGGSSRAADDSAAAGKGGEPERSCRSSQSGSDTAGPTVGWCMTPRGTGAYDLRVAGDSSAVASTSDAAARPGKATPGPAAPHQSHDRAEDGNAVGWCMTPRGGGNYELANPGGLLAVGAPEQITEPGPAHSQAHASSRGASEDGGPVGWSMTPRGGGSYELAKPGVTNSQPISVAAVQLVTGTGPTAQAVPEHRGGAQGASEDGSAVGWCLTPRGGGSYELAKSVGAQLESSNAPARPSFVPPTATVPQGHAVARPESEDGGGAVGWCLAPRDGGSYELATTAGAQQGAATSGASRSHPGSRGASEDGGAVGWCMTPRGGGTYELAAAKAAAATAASIPAAPWQQPEPVAGHSTRRSEASDAHGPSGSGTGWCLTPRGTGAYEVQLGSQASGAPQPARLPIWESDPEPLMAAGLPPVPPMRPSASSIPGSVNSAGVSVSARPSLGGSSDSDEVLQPVRRHQADSEVTGRAPLRALHPPATYSLVPLPSQTSPSPLQPPAPQLSVSQQRREALGVGVASGGSPGGAQAKASGYGALLRGGSGSGTATTSSPGSSAAGAAPAAPAAAGRKVLTEEAVLQGGGAAPVLLAMIQEQRSQRGGSVLNHMLMPPFAGSPSRDATPAAAFGGQSGAARAQLLSHAPPVMQPQVSPPAPPPATFFPPEGQLAAGGRPACAHEPGRSAAVVAGTMGPAWGSRGSAPGVFPPFSAPRSLPATVSVGTSTGHSLGGAAPSPRSSASTDTHTGRSGAGPSTGDASTSAGNAFPPSRRTTAVGDIEARTVSRFARSFFAGAVETRAKDEAAQEDPGEVRLASQFFLGPAAAAAASTSQPAAPTARPATCNSSSAPSPPRPWHSTAAAAAMATASNRRSASPTASPQQQPIQARTSTSLPSPQPLPTQPSRQSTLNYEAPSGAASPSSHSLASAAVHSEVSAAAYQTPPSPFSSPRHNMNAMATAQQRASQLTSEQAGRLAQAVSQSVQTSVAGIPIAASDTGMAELAAELGKRLAADVLEFLTGTRMGNLATSAAENTGAAAALNTSDAANLSQAHPTAMVSSGAGPTSLLHTQAPAPQAPQHVHSISITESEDFIDYDFGGQVLQHDMQQEQPTRGSPAGSTRGSSRSGSDAQLSRQHQRHSQTQHATQGQLQSQWEGPVGAAPAAAVAQARSQPQPASPPPPPPPPLSSLGPAVPAGSAAAAVLAALAQPAQAPNDMHAAPGRTSSLAQPLNPQEHVASAPNMSAAEAHMDIYTTMDSDAFSLVPPSSQLLRLPSSGMGRIPDPDCSNPGFLDPAWSGPYARELAGHLQAASGTSGGSTPARASKARPSDERGMPRFTVDSDVFSLDIQDLQGGHQPPSRYHSTLETALEYEPSADACSMSSAEGTSSRPPASVQPTMPATHQGNTTAIAIPPAPPPQRYSSGRRHEDMAPHSQDLGGFDILSTMVTSVLGSDGGYEGPEPHAGMGVLAAGSLPAGMAAPGSPLEKFLQNLEVELEGDLDMVGAQGAKRGTVDMAAMMAESRVRRSLQKLMAARQSCRIAGAPPVGAALGAAETAAAVVGDPQHPAAPAGGLQGPQAEQDGGVAAGNTQTSDAQVPQARGSAPDVGKGGPLQSHPPTVKAQASTALRPAVPEAADPGPALAMESGAPPPAPVPAVTEPTLDEPPLDPSTDLPSFTALLEEMEGGEGGRPATEAERQLLQGMLQVLQQAVSRRNSTSSLGGMPPADPAGQASFTRQLEEAEEAEGMAASASAAVAAVAAAPQQRGTAQPQPRAAVVAAGLQPPPPAPAGSDGTAATAGDMHSPVATQAARSPSHHSMRHAQSYSGGVPVTTQPQSMQAKTRMQDLQGPNSLSPSAHHAPSQASGRALPAVPMPHVGTSRPPVPVRSASSNRREGGQQPSLVDAVSHSRRCTGASSVSSIGEIQSDPVDQFDLRHLLLSAHSLWSMNRALEHVKEAHPGVVAAVMAASKQQQPADLAALLTMQGVDGIGQDQVQDMQALATLKAMMEHNILRGAFLLWRVATKL